MDIRRYAAVLCALMLLSGCASESSTSTDSTAESSSTAETSLSSSEAAPSEAAPVQEESSIEPQSELNVNASTVSFSAESGVYPEKLSLELSSPDGGEIRYTLDGSDPRTSSTALIYSSPVEIDKRSADKNVVSAVDTTLISGNFNEINYGEGGFVCKIKPPSDDAVDKCTVIRACAVMEDGSVTQAFANTYFIGTAEEHIKGLAESCEAMGTPLAVISIQADYDDLFSPDRGIYVKGDVFDAAFEKALSDGSSLESETARQLDANYKQRGRDWERSCHVDMFELSPDSCTTALSQDCGLRVQGNYSRSDLIKGLRLCARKEYGEKRFDYPVFSGLTASDGTAVESFKTLVLRAGGNCAFSAKFNDTYWQKLSSSLDCTTKASRPCVVYLNGEYWGLYVLEEDYSDDYFADHFGVDKKDVIVYKGDAEALKLGYKLDEGELPENEKESYYFELLLEFFRSHKDLASQEDLYAFSKLVDVESCRDYFLSEVWINNKWDWPGKNWSMWKTASVTEGSEYADGRWRFMFYDMEFGGVSGSSDCRTNTIKEDNYKPKGLLDMGTDNPAVLCFAYLMTNETFKADYLEELGKLSEGIYSKEKLTAMLDSLSAQYGPLYEQFFERYPETGSAEEALEGGYSSVKCIRDFIAGRADYIPKMISWAEKQ